MLFSMICSLFACWTTQQSPIPVKRAQENIPILFEYEELSMEKGSNNEEESAKINVVVRAGYAHDTL